MNECCVQLANERDAAISKAVESCYAQYNAMRDRLENERDAAVAREKALEIQLLVARKIREAREGVLSTIDVDRDKWADRARKAEAERDAAVARAEALQHCVDTWLRYAEYSAESHPKTEMQFSTALAVTRTTFRGPAPPPADLTQAEKTSESPCNDRLTDGSFKPAPTGSPESRRPRSPLERKALAWFDKRGIINFKIDDIESLAGILIGTRIEALEEAALVCEDYADSRPIGTQFLRMLAQRIRALKTETGGAK